MERGCWPVDLGYNVEESLPNLILYGLTTGDEEVLDIVTESLRQHLNFMLPDGGWDNSWGSRNYKWTYWGSRTSDGCQPAYLLLADRDSRFAEAAYRNTKLLKECTNDGILYGGPHYFSHGELPCLHHTICHAKALAAVLNHKPILDMENIKRVLPRDKAEGVKYFREIDTWLVSIGTWRATITASDIDCSTGKHASGGALTVLYHQEIGPVILASLNKYKLVEQNNMQRHRDRLDMPLTPHIKYVEDDLEYLSLNDFGVDIKHYEGADSIKFNVKGQLKDIKHKEPDGQEISFKNSYCFYENQVSINIKVESDIEVSNIVYNIPIVSMSDETINKISDYQYEILKEKGKVTIKSSKPLKMIGSEGKRIFNHVPGIEAVPFYIDLCPGEKVEVDIY